MRIVIAGGTGFLGQPLAARLLADAHDVVVLTRRGDKAPAGRSARMVAWTPNGEAGAWASEIDGAGAVVNLAGEPIAGRRWTAAHKAGIIASRVQATRSIVAAIGRASSPPAVLVNGSAVGFYGPHGDEIVTEHTGEGSDFLAQVCGEWEAEAHRAGSDRTRVVCVRTGIVLEKDGGALPQMLPPFKLGVGGPVGSGRQYWPWIHREDWIALVSWAIRAPAAAAEFARALGRALHRPAFMPAPGFALRLLLGEMADGLLLSGQRAIPERAAGAGFEFRYPRLDAALAAIFKAS
jgi:uncharacterized protein (TIGR01777 family)